MVHSLSAPPVPLSLGEFYTVRGEYLSRNGKKIRGVSVAFEKIPDRSIRVPSGPRDTEPLVSVHASLIAKSNTDPVDADVSLVESLRDVNGSRDHGNPSSPRVLTFSSSSHGILPTSIIAVTVFTERTRARNSTRD